jgi:hypothetical protein
MFKASYYYAVHVLLNTKFEKSVFRILCVIICFLCFSTCKHMNIYMVIIRYWPIANQLQGQL